MRRAAVVVAACALLAACQKAPGVRIESPRDGDQLTAAFDLDPAAPGVQLAVQASVDASDGSEAWAYAGAAPSRAVVQGGKALFERVTIPDGEAELKVTVVDRGSQKQGQGAIRVTADSLANGCRFVEPAPGLVRSDDPGDGSLWLQDVRVLCRGLKVSQPVALFLGTEQQPLLAALDAQGVASFRAELVPGLNLLMVTADGVAPVFTDVRVDSDRCSVQVDPPSGALLNAAADRDPAAPGLQARIALRTTCPADSLARLEVFQAGQRVQSLASTLDGSGAAAFDVTLPDGADVAVRAQAGPAGHAGASRLAHYQVDSVLPTAELLEPAAGAVLLDADDASPSTPGFQVRFSGHASGVGPGGSLLLIVDEAGTPLFADADTGAFSALVTLENGAHSAQVVARRASGNTASSAAVSFNVSALGASVAFASPLDGGRLSLADLTPAPGGATANLTLAMVNLAGGALDVACGGPATHVEPIPGGDSVTAAVFVPIASCQPAQVVCTATASPRSPPGRTFTAAPISILADAAAPVLTLTSPPDGSSTRAAIVAIEGTTSCAGEAQTWQLRAGGQLVDSGPVVGNRVSTTVALAPGVNSLEVAVLDATGNRGAITAVVTRLVGDPTPVFLSPSAGAQLGAATADVRVQLDDRPAGAIVELSLASVEAGGAWRAPLSAATQAAGAHLVATFAGVAQPEGNATLRACVTDPVVPAVPAVCVTEAVTVATGRPVCNVLAPADGAVLGAADDTRPDLSGFQTAARVQTSGDGAVALTVTWPDGSAHAVAPQTPAGSGLRTATFP
jgi:hypothetical protein